MGKFSELLFACDFDHTLSGYDDSVPAANLEAIHYFTDNGGLFSVASGRSMRLLRSRVAQLPVNAPCLCFNGAACYDYRTQELLYAHPLPDLAPEILAAAFRFDAAVGAEIQTLDGHYPYGDCEARNAFLRSQSIEPAYVDGLPPLPWMKLVFTMPAGGLFSTETPNATPPAVAQYMKQLTAALQPICGGTCYLVRSMPRLLEIGAVGFNKGDSARELARRLGRSTLVCAGDAPNDAQMLAAADYAFAPSDCDPEITHIPGLRQTVPCAEGAVAAAIAQLDKLLV